MKWVFYSLLQLMPSVLALSVPMAYQLALLLALASLSERGELLALRASGFSFKQLAWPAAVFAAVLCAALLWVNNFAGPLGFRRFGQSQRFMAEQLSKLRLESGTFMTLGNWRLYADEADAETGSLKKVHLFRSAAGGSDWTLRVSAPTGKYSVSAKKGFGLTLYGGEFQRADKLDPNRLVMAKFSEYSVFIPFGGGSERSLYLSEMTTPQILAGIRAGGLSVSRESEYKTAASSRLAVAFSPLVFFWVSAPLGFGLSRRGRGWAMVMSLAVLFAFYGALACGQSVGKQLPWLSWWGAGLADLAGLAAGFALWKKNVR